MAYIKRIEYSDYRLTSGTVISFIFDYGRIIEGIVAGDEKGGFFVNIPYSYNDKIFEILNINNSQKIALTEKAYGYTSSGMWPVARTIGDLKKLLNALLDINNPKATVRTNTIVSVSKKKRIKLNFNI